MADYSSTVLIEELDPRGYATPQRQVHLQGPSLPHMGAAWSGENEMTTDWYAGNPDEATQQVLVPKEMPSRWTGEWHRTMMGGTPTLYVDNREGAGGSTLLHDPDVLAQLLEDMFRGGQRLRVTWVVDSNLGRPDDPASNNPFGGRKVRVGRAKSWSFKYTRLQDIAWEIEFHWSGRGAAQAAVASTRSAGVADAFGKYADAMQAILDAQDLAQSQKYAPSALTLGQIESFAAAPGAIANSFGRKVQQLLNTGKQLADIANTVATQPAQVANAGLNVARETVDQARAMGDSISAIPAEYMATKAKARDVLRAYKNFGQQCDDAYALATAAAAVEQQMLVLLARQNVALAADLRGQLAPPQAAAIRPYRTRAGDTPQKLSMKFFDTPDRDIDILQANRLPWHTPSFVPGTIIIIPSLSGNASQGV